MSHRQQRARYARRKQANAKMRALGVAGGVAIAGLVPAAAQADQTFQVTTSADTGAGSLRQAMLDANAAGGSDTITFAPGVTGQIRPQSDLPALNTDLTIDGPGAKSLTISGQNDPGAQAMFAAGNHHLTISGLEIDSDNTGAVSETGAAGGLVLDAIQIQGNGGPIPASGAISVTDGSLTVSDSYVGANTGTTAGGILATGAASVTVEDSTFVGDTSKGSGGAINLQNTGTTTIADSSFENNVAASRLSGGGIEVGATSALTLENSIVELDTGTTHPDLEVATGGSANVKFSLIKSAGDVAQTGVTYDIETNTLAGQSPILVGPGDNGGPTNTLMPASNSPVIDAGKEFAGQTKDQRGALRTVGTTTDTGDGTDIGAVERQPVPTVTSISPAGGSAGDTVTITGTNSGAVEQVKFGTVNAQSFTVVNPTTITAVVPVLASLPSTVDVAVVEAEGASAPSSADQFSGTAGVHSFAVTQLGDTGSGSLRDAISQADIHPGDDTITFASGLSGTIAVGSDLPTITTELHIQGPGARQLAIDATPDTTPSHSVIQAQPASGGVTISGLTVRGGLSGGISAYGDLTLDAVTVTGNGLAPTSDPATHNRIDGVYDGYGTLTLQNTTVTGNLGYLGAGISSYNGTVDLRDSTISGNHLGSAGGLEAFSSDVNIDDSTITGNVGGDEGGGVYLYAHALKLRDTVVAGNTATGAAATNPDVHLLHSASGTAAFSLIGQTAAATGFTLDAQSQALVGQDPKVGPVQNNGGPTDTELPQPGSPLLDAGQAFGQATDQRGQPRPSRVSGTTLPSGGDGSDIGAVEVQAPALSGVSPASGAVGSTVTISGSGFTGASAVSFGSTAASSFHVVDDGHITAVVPAGSGTVDARVTTPYGQTAVVAGDHFTYTVIVPPVPAPPAPARPAIGGLSAHTGSSGQTLKLTGLHFTGATSVKFGPTTAKFRIASDGSITATVPSGHGRVDVSVTGPGGASAAVSADRFSYLSASVGHHRAAAKWKRSNVVVDTGLFASCPAGGDQCAVSFKVTTVVPATLAAVRKTKTKSLTVGSGHFHVRPGKRGEVTFTLTRKGLRALELLGKLKLTVSVTAVDGSVTTKGSRTITIHLPKRPKKK